MLEVKGRKLAAVFPNVSDGLPRDFLPWLCRALEFAGRSERVAFEPGTDPFEVGIAVVPGATSGAAGSAGAVGYVLDDAGEWRVSGVAPVDGTPLEVRYQAIRQGGTHASDTARSVSERIATRGLRLEIGGLGSFKQARLHVVDAVGDLQQLAGIDFSPSRSLHAAIRGTGVAHRARVGGATAAEWKAEAERIEAWAVAVRDLLLASGVCGAPPLGLFYVDERPDSAWTDPATGKTTLKSATRVVRFVADPPDLPIVARPEQALTRGA
jgi:hypothetical protein